jgi:predicted Zn-dependent protease
MIPLSVVHRGIIGVMKARGIPFVANAYVMLAGLCLRDDKKIDRALQLAQKGLELEPGVVANQVMYGNVLVRLGRIEEARRLAKSMEQAAESAEDRALVSAFVRSLARVPENNERRKRAATAGPEALELETRPGR